MRTRPNRRRGASIVEAAFILPILVLFLFGIFEYCRFIFLLQMVENAAREGARFAVTRTADGTTMQNVIDYTTSKMVGRQSELSGYNVTVQNVDPNTGIPVPGAAWNDAPFGGAIMVQITGTYSFMLPQMLHLPTSFQVRATSMMSSEAN
jgi:hypothetical protein